VLRDGRHTDVQVTLARGDTLVLYTDGVLDSGRPALGCDGLERVLRESRGLPPAELVRRLYGAAAAGQRDDIAILAVMAPQ
jgi:serine phosphatase RsbU (regulator of sigma subunit)